MVKYKSYLDNLFILLSALQSNVWKPLLPCLGVGGDRGGGCVYVCAFTVGHPPFSAHYRSVSYVTTQFPDAAHCAYMPTLFRHLCVVYTSFVTFTPILQVVLLSLFNRGEHLDSEVV